QSEIDRAQSIAIVNVAERSRSGIAAADAIPPLERWLKIVPDDVAAIDALGQAYYLLQDFTNAARLWERGLQLAPQHEDLLRRMFLLCHETQQIDRGIEYGQRLVSLNPWDYEYLGRFAHMLGQANRLEEASQFGERALQVDPLAYHIHDWLAKLYAV